MDRELARRAHAILQAALEVAPDERPAFVAAQCAADSSLHARTAALLAALERSGHFLERPALAATRHDQQDSPRPMEKIGDYRMVRVIGVGGMATVYEAIQERLRRRVALKVMRQGLAHTSAVHRFQYETEILARLQHPGIAQIFEAGTWEDAQGVTTPFFAMEFVSDARTIIEYAREQRLRLPERLQMFANVCDAVQHGHQLGVIHRDLKPGNLLVDFTGRPKVIDFGVARSSDPAQAWITQQADLGQIIGTLNYMSPEQCAGADIDIRTDVYSLGVVLYELACGRLPHDLSEAPLIEALRIVCNEPPTRPSTIDPHLRGDFEALVLKAIEKDPARRYHTAEALAADIRRHLNHQTIDARPPTFLYQCRRFARRNLTLVTAAAVLLLTIFCGAILSASLALQAKSESVRRRQAELQALEQRDAARRQAYIANIAGAIAALQTNEYQQLRTRLAAAPEEHRGWEWRFLSGLAERSEQTIVAHDDMVYGFAISPDGSRLATGARDGSLAVWDAQRGICTTRTEGLADIPIFSVAFSPDGQWIVSGSEDGAVRVWDPATGRPMREFRGHERRVLSVSWGSHDLIASASEDGAACLRDSTTGEIRRVLDDQPEGIHGVQFSKEGAYLLTWNRRGLVWLRSADGARVLRRWSFGGRPECGGLSDDNRLAALGGTGGRAMVWDVTSGELVHELRAPLSAGTLRSLTFSHRGDRLAAGQIHRGIIIWSLRDGRQLEQLPGHAEAVAGVIFAADDRRLYSAAWDRTIRIWDTSATASSGLVTTLSGHDSHVLATAFSSDGELLASGGRDATIRLWDPELGLQLGILRGHEGAVSALAFGPDGQWLISGSRDSTLRFWDTLTGRSAPALDAQTPVWTLAFSPDGRRLAAAGEDGLVRVWHVETRTIERTFGRHDRRIIHLAFSPDGRRLASASRDHSVRIWEMATGTLLHTLEGHEADVFAVVFSHDGRQLYSGSRDQTVRIWDAESARCTDVLKGHGQFVTTLALSPDGARLAAGSWFGEVLLWDAAKHDLAASFKGHEHAVRAVCFDPQGRWLAACSYDETIRLFDAAPPNERRAGRAAAQAQFDAAREMVNRLSRRYATPTELLAATEAESVLNAELRACVRKCILMTALAATDSP